MKFRRRFVAASFVLSTLGHSAIAFSEDQLERPDRLADEGFVSVFDGKTLDGWHAVPEECASDWSVRDGLIVGSGSADRLAYLVLKDDKLASEFTDNSERGRLDHGAIGLQIHDKGMRVEFADIRLKRLAATDDGCGASGECRAESPARVTAGPYFFTLRPFHFST